MPKPTAPPADATDLPTAIQIARLAAEINALVASAATGRSADEIARINEQIKQRTVAQVYLYNKISSVNPATPATDFLVPEKRVVKSLLGMEATRLNGKTVAGGKATDKHAAARAADLIALSTGV